MDRFECPNCGWPMEEEADDLGAVTKDCDETCPNYDLDSDTIEELCIGGRLLGGDGRETELGPCLCYCHADDTKAD